jgi:hypothetical protein
MPVSAASLCSLPVVACTLPGACARLRPPPGASVRMPPRLGSTRSQQFPGSPRHVQWHSSSSPLPEPPRAGMHLPRPSPVRVRAYGLPPARPCACRPRLGSARSSRVPCRHLECSSPPPEQAVTI